MKALLFLLLFLLVACGDNAIFQSSDTKKITNKFFLVSSKEKDPSHLRPVDSIFTVPAETLFVRAAAFTENKIIPTNELGEYFFTRYWLFKGFMLNEETIRVTWNKSSIDTLCHFSIDLLGDTLQQCINVFVNSTAKVKALMPENGTNTIQTKDTLLFQWEIDGLDSWENAKCEIFFNSNSKELWLSKPREVSCTEGLQIAASNYTDSSSNAPIYFWGVRFTTYSNVPEVAYSEPQYFRLASPGSSSFVVPIKYDHSKRNHKEGILKVFQKDSLIDSFSFSQDTTFIIKGLQNDSSYKFLATENYRTDYQADSLEVKLSPNVITTTDTLILKDKVAPEVIPLKNTFNKNDSIKFFAAENGSGLNALRSAVILLDMKDTVPYVFSKNLISFSFDCESTCNFQIHLEDNAKNKSPSKYWKAKYTDSSIFISGPFNAGENQ